MGYSTSIYGVIPMKDKAKLPSIAVIGGDKRARYIAKMLAEDGFEVGTALLGRDIDVREMSVDFALKCDVVILPTPATKDGENLFAPEAEDKVNLVDIISGARAGTLLLGGNLGESAVNSASLRGVRVRDYFSRDGVAEANAVPTAEGALAIAMQNSDITVSGSRCLVIGCGRCGRALARLLRGCDADVTVSSRKRKDRLWTWANGCHTVNTGEIAEKAEQFDYILNTVPVRVVDAGVLRKMREDALLIELASGAAGVDMTAAAQLGRRAIFAPALPGKCAPKTAAQILYRSIISILTEEFSWIDFD